MSFNIRQNFLLPKDTKKLLDESIPKGQQSRFVAQAIEERLRAEKSFGALHAPAKLTLEDPVSFSRKLRRSWDIP